MKWIYIVHEKTGRCEHGRWAFDNYKSATTFIKKKMSETDEDRNEKTINLVKEYLYKNKALTKKEVEEYFENYYENKNEDFRRDYSNYENSYKYYIELMAIEES